MPLDKEAIKTAYPLPSYNYRVTFLNVDEVSSASFAEVSGLSMEYEHVTYKHGLSFLMGSKIIPGQQQAIRITLRRGIIKERSALSDWIYKTHHNPFYSSAKRDIQIDLCDASGEPVVSWTVSSAMPIKLDVSNFDANSNDVAVESMELVAHDLRVIYQ